LFFGVGVELDGVFFGALETNMTLLVGLAFEDRIQLLGFFIELE